MQILFSEDKINQLIKESVLLNVREIEFNQVLKEVYPYFKDAIEEEHAKLRRYMLSEGYISHYEYMIEEQRQLKEGLFSIIADVGITLGQMVGGPVGQAAGFAGAVKYSSDFIAVADKSFLEMVGPLMGLFFSIQALVFPMPAVGSIKTILLGFFKGIGNVISGAGGLFARGVMALLGKGHGFIAKAIGILVKALKGVLTAIKGGGPTIAKLESKVGGTMFSKATKLMTTAMEGFMKRLDILKEGLKTLGKKDVKEVPGMIKNILVKAFQTSKDKLDDALNAIKNTKAGQAVVAAKSKAGKALEEALKGATFTATDDIAKISLKGITSKGGTDLSKYTIGSVANGRLFLQQTDEAGKVIGTLYVSADTSAKIMAKSPAVKKWIVSNLDDTAKVAFNKSFGAATSTTKAVLQTSAKALKGIPAKLLQKFQAQIGTSIKAANKWITEYMAKNPQLLEKMIGTTIKGSTKGHTYKFLGPDAAGKMLIQTNKIRGKIVEPFTKAVSPAQFFSSYGRQFFSPKIASNAPGFKHFLSYLSHIYPPKRAFADIARISAASGKDAKIVPGTYGNLEMPEDEEQQSGDVEMPEDEEQQSRAFRYTGSGKTLSQKLDTVKKKFS